MHPADGDAAGHDDAPHADRPQPMDWISDKALDAKRAGLGVCTENSGAAMVIAGAAMLGVSAVLCVLLYQWMETAVLYFVLAQAALTMGTVPLTERALKRKFGSV